MKLFAGFVVAIVTFSFCSASQNQNGRITEEAADIYIEMDDDLVDRTLTVIPDGKYIIHMSLKHKRDYKLSLSVFEATCSDFGAVVEIGNEDRIGIHEKQTWRCTNVLKTNPIRIFNSLTNTMDITIPPIWENKVKFLITAQLDVSSSFNCPTNFFRCSGCSKFENVTEREFCIPSELSCNGRENCASCTTQDEGYCAGSIPCPPKECLNGFHDGQYMLTILLAGLFFIMSPIVIVLVLFYHKRVSSSARARERNASENLAITRNQLRNDRPPTYEDVHDTKTPPPNFQDVFPQTSYASTSANVNIPEGIGSNV